MFLKKMMLIKQVHQKSDISQIKILCINRNSAVDLINDFVESYR